MRSAGSWATPRWLPPYTLFGAMKTRPMPRRFRRILKWVGVLATALLFLAALTTLRWRLSWLSGKKHIGIVLAAGAIVPTWEDQELRDRFRGSILGNAEVAQPPGFHIEKMFDDLSDARYVWSRFGLFPQSGVNVPHRYISLPLWIPFVLIGGTTLLLFWCDRHRIPPCCCQSCGYNLTGNVSGSCPECGEPCDTEASATGIPPSVFDSGVSSGGRKQGCAF